MAETMDFDLRTEIRDVTDDEVAFFEEKGWVMLEGFFSPELAAHLQRAAVPMLGSEATNGLRSSVRPISGGGVEPFSTVSRGPRMGEVAHKLVNRARLTRSEVPTRFLDDLVWCKDPGGGDVGYHQDSGAEGADRIGRVNFWVALNEVTPDMGAMRFLTGSHREGPLGWPDDFVAEGEQHDTLSQYDRLTDLYELSPPFHYRPGDATVHKGWLIHGSPPNTTDRERWCYILEYTPADTRYRNARYHGDGDFGTLLSDEVAYPVVYPQNAATA